MLLRSGKIVKARPRQQNMAIKQDDRLGRCNYLSSAKREETFRRRGDKKLQIETETIEKLLEGLNSLVDLLTSRIRASEEISLS